MDELGAAVAAIVLAMLLVGGGAAAQLAYEDTGATDATFTETFDAGAEGDVITFDESNRENVFYGENPTVTDTNGHEYLQGVDYRWYTENGTLEVLDGAMVNTTTNDIEYSYRAPSTQQSQIADTLALLIESGMYLPLVLIILVVLLGAAALGGLA